MQSERKAFDAGTGGNDSALLMLWEPFPVSIPMVVLPIQAAATEH